MACVVVSTKVEEFIDRRLRYIIETFHYLNSKFKKIKYEHMTLDEYKKLKAKVIRQELRILTALGYNVRVNHPHKIIFIYLNMLNLGKKSNLVQSAWNYMNDALRSPTIFPCHKPEIVACACICLAARNQFIPLPTDPHWFTIFNASSVEILEIVREILNIYGFKVKVDNLLQSIDAIANCKIKSPTGTPKKNNYSPSVQENNSPSLTRSNVQEPEAKRNFGSKSGDKDLKKDVISRHNSNSGSYSSKSRNHDDKYRHTQNHNNGYSKSSYHRSHSPQKYDRHSGSAKTDKYGRSYDERYFRDSERDRYRPSSNKQDEYSRDHDHLRKYHSDDCNKYSNSRHYDSDNKVKHPSKYQDDDKRSDSRKHLNSKDDKSSKSKYNVIIGDK